MYNTASRRWRNYKKNLKRSQIDVMQYKEKNEFSLLQILSPVFKPMLIVGMKNDLKAANVQTTYNNDLSTLLILLFLDFFCRRIVSPFIERRAHFNTSSFMSIVQIFAKSSESDQKLLKSHPSLKRDFRTGRRMRLILLFLDECTKLYCGVREEKKNLNCSPNDVVSHGATAKEIYCYVNWVSSSISANFFSFFLHSTQLFVYKMMN